MTKKTLIPLLLPLGLSLWTACVDETSSLGASLVESSFYNVLTDTCTVDLSTVYQDSMVTRGDTLLQVGRYRDSLWGDLTATYYAEFTGTSFTPGDDYTYTFDSLVLRIRHTGHYLGDTLTPQRITAYQLKEVIELEDDEELYNRTVLATEATPIFSFTYNPRPKQLKEQEIRLPDALGEQLLKDIVAEEEYFEDQDKFRNRFPGLALVPDADGSCVCGFAVGDSSMTVTLHYKEVSNNRTEKELVFKVNTEHAYTGVQHDRRGTALADMEYGIEQARHSYDMEYRSFLQGLTGFYNQIEFPYLNNLQDEGDIVSVESATLYLYPLAGSYGDHNELPSSLTLYISSENNAFEDYNGDDVSTQTGSLTLDELFRLDTYYSFDLTDYMQTNFGTWGDRRQKLLLSLTSDDFEGTLRSIVFTNRRDQVRQCKLEVRYKTYREQK